MKIKRWKGNVRGGIDMKTAMRAKKEFKGLNTEKKQLLKKSMGSMQSRIDFNKVRDEWKYGANRF